MELKNLVDLALEAQDVARDIVATGGELTEEIEMKLAVNEKQLTTKIDGYHEILKRLDEEAGYWKARAEEYLSVSRACKNAKERLKENIKKAMYILKQDSIEGSDIRYFFAKAAPRLVISDEKALPKEYTVVKVEPNKDKIKTDLKENKEVPGATLETSVALRTAKARKVK